MRLLVNSDRSLSEAVDRLRDEYAEKKYLIVSVRAGKDRSLDQNRLMWSWIGEISGQTFQTEDEAHAELKLNFAVPILRAEDPEFCKFYDDAIGGLSYEDQLKAMRFVPATSLMTVPQMSRFLEAVQMEYGKQGILLEAE